MNSNFSESPVRLTGDISRPFNKAKREHITMKVINHLADEVMKVFKVWSQEN